MADRLLSDAYGRVMRDLRISVTDRCNFRCLYCLPETEAAEQFYRHQRGPSSTPASVPISLQWLPRAELLTFEEIERVARLMVGLGIQKIRFTGGEPLLRQQMENLVGRLARIEGVQDLAMTCNGFLFQQKAAALREAGLRRVTFSLDSLEAENFRRITGRDGLAQVLASIRLGQKLGLTPVKVNAVIIRGLNDHEIESLAQFACDEGLALRFIEFMPLDSRKAWHRELIVPGREILSRLQARFTLEPVSSDNPSETARRWRLAGGAAEVGIIAPVTEAFCGHCNRLRLTADGKLRTCLFSLVEHDLRAQLRNGRNQEQLCDYVRQVVWGKEAGHRINQTDFTPPARTMSCIGG